MSAGSDEKPRTMIGWRTATVLYLLLIVFACATLHGKALALGLIIVGGIAAKSYLHFWKSKSE
ncbi:MAG TPA: hypothetical protein VH477_07860 [Bryobacteraceae bacterium]